MPGGGTWHIKSLYTVKGTIVVLTGHGRSPMRYTLSNIEELGTTQPYMFLHNTRT